jgi:glycosyltransferase involved in cell wall biosynthesis
MKILMVNKFLYNRGGSETYMFQISEYLKKQGHEVYFFGMKDEENIVDTDEKSLVENLDFHKKSLKTLLYPFKIIYSIEARKKIAKILDSFKPDIVHLNNYNFQLTPSIIYEVKKRNLPIVQTVHDPVVVCPNHSLFNYNEGEICEKCKGNKYFFCIKTKCIHNSMVKSVFGAIEAIIYNKLNTYEKVDKFICPSQFINEKIVEFGVNGQKTITMHNFSMLDIGDNLNKKRNYILYFGRLSQEKGIITLLESAKKLKNYSFKICGTGPLEEYMKNYINQNNLKNVELLGFKTGNELKMLIKNAKVSIYPSVWYENCPMSVIESKGLGTPVIGSKIGGIPELIRDNKDGFVFEANNSEDLSEKIKNIMEFDEEKYSSFVNESLKDFKGRFQIKIYYDKLVKLYKDIV